MWDGSSVSYWFSLFPLLSRLYLLSVSLLSLSPLFSIVSFVFSLRSSLLSFLLSLLSLSLSLSPSLFSLPLCLLPHAALLSPAQRSSLSSEPTPSSQAQRSALFAVLSPSLGER